MNVPEATKKGYAEATVGQAINLAQPNSKTRRGRVSDIANTLDTQQQQHTLTTEARIRRLTPVECERLQGFPETEVSAIIDVCIDHQNNSVNVVLQNLKSQRLAGIAGSDKSKRTAPSVVKTSVQNYLQENKPVQENVHIFLEDKKISLHNHEKSLSYVSGATSQSSLALPIQEEDFVQMIAGMLRIVEKITHDGKVELAQSDKPLTVQESGNTLEKPYGYEITLPVSDVMRNITTLKESLKSITSSHLDIKSLDTTLATLSYYVASATSGATASPTQKNSTFRLHLLEKYGWTQYGKDGELISDTQRYKMCGNAVTTNVIQAVFERIFDERTF